MRGTVDIARVESMPLKVARQRYDEWLPTCDWGMCPPFAWWWFASEKLDRDATAEEACAGFDAFLAEKKQHHNASELGLSDWGHAATDERGE